MPKRYKSKYPKHYHRYLAERVVNKPSATKTETENKADSTGK